MTVAPDEARTRAGQPRDPSSLPRHDGDLLRGRPAHASRSCRPLPDGTTDLAALERELADARPTRRRRAHRPAQRLRDPRAHGRGVATGPRGRRAVRGRRRARLAGRPGARRPSTTPTSRSARASRWASASSTAVRTWACWRAKSDLVRQIPGRLVGRDHGPRRPSRVRDDAARARAGHPARQGSQQHLHQPGAVRAGRDGLRGDARSPRAARRGRSRRGARRELEAALADAGAPRVHSGAYLNEFAVHVPDAPARPRRAPRTGHPGRSAAGRLVPGRPDAPRRAAGVRDRGDDQRRHRAFCERHCARWSA